MSLFGSREMEPLFDGCSIMNAKLLTVNYKLLTVLHSPHGDGAALILLRGVQHKVFALPDERQYLIQVKPAEWVQRILHARDIGPGGVEVSLHHASRVCVQSAKIVKLRQPSKKNRL